MDSKDDLQVEDERRATTRAADGVGGESEDDELDAARTDSPLPGDAGSGTADCPS